MIKEPEYLYQKKRNQQNLQTQEEFHAPFPTHTHTPLQYSLVFQAESREDDNFILGSSLQQGPT